MRFEFVWKDYTSAAERRRRAARELDKKRDEYSPVRIEGKQIAKTFWGQAWCSNLERYSDYANRLPRGRSYLRDGSVVDLQIASGEISARVSGSRLYTVSLQIVPVSSQVWKSICQDCAGGIDSMVELLQGRFAKGVMERICRPKAGLFPAPVDIKMACNCPDRAGMCKHLAAVLYGVGARLDEQPELLFRLRGTDAAELIAHSAQVIPLTARKPAPEKLLGESDLAGLFGIELAPVRRTKKRNGR